MTRSQSSKLGSLPVKCQIIVCHNLSPVMFSGTSLKKLYISLNSRIAIKIDLKVKLFRHFGHTFGHKKCSQVIRSCDYNTITPGILLYCGLFIASFNPLLQCHIFCAVHYQATKHIPATFTSYSQNDEYNV